MIRVHLGFLDLTHRRTVVTGLRGLEPWEAGVLRDEPGQGVIYDMLGTDRRLCRIAVEGRVSLATAGLPEAARDVTLHAVQLGVGLEADAGAR